MRARLLGLILVSFASGCLPKSPGPSTGGNGSSGGGSSGAGGGGSGGGGASQSCSPPGSTQACCGAGTQTCAGIEFPTWGPCLASDGTTLTCGQGTCTTGEFS